MCPGSWSNIGGVRDIKDMFRTLRTPDRNMLDDGRVVDHHSLADEAIIDTSEETDPSIQISEEEELIVD